MCFLSSRSSILLFSPCVQSSCLLLSRLFLYQCMYFPFLFSSLHVSTLSPSPTQRNRCFLQCYVTRSVLIVEAIAGAVFNLIRQRCVGSPRGLQPQDVRGERRGGKSREAEKSSSLQHSIRPIKHNGTEPQSAALNTCCCNSCSESIHVCVQESSTGHLDRC